MFAKEMGVKTKHMRPDILLKIARFWNDHDNVESRNGLNVQLFMVSFMFANEHFPPLTVH